MKIGIIGLGNIAQKAYLPIVLTQYPDIEWYLSTRNEEKLGRIAKQYHIHENHCFTDWTSMIEQDLDGVFVHTATDTHSQIIQVLLEKGIDVFVDKPVTESLAETRRLYQLAEEKNCLLMAGFNRRFAPFVEKVNELPEKNQIIVQKNRADRVYESIRYLLYDIFIHPLDTALFLMGSKGDLAFQQAKVVDGNLETIQVILKNKHISTFVSVNLKSGANEESIECHGKEGTVIVRNLDEYKKVTPGQVERVEFGPWDQTLEKRGFVDMIDAFIHAVENQTANPVSPESSILSHQIVEKIICEIENSQG